MAIDPKPITLKIRHHQGGTLEALLEFLQRKVPSMTLHLSNPRQEGDTLLLEVGNRRQADELTKLSGIRFAGDKLSISMSRPPKSTSSPRPSVVEVLREFIQSRYDASRRMLILDEMDKDPMLKQAGIKGLGVAEPHSRIGPAIFKLVSTHCPEVRFIFP